MCVSACITGDAHPPLRGHIHNPSAHGNPRSRRHEPARVDPASPSAWRVRGRVQLAAHGHPRSTGAREAQRAQQQHLGANSPGVVDALYVV